MCVFCVCALKQKANRVNVVYACVERYWTETSADLHFSTRTHRVGIQLGKWAQSTQSAGTFLERQNAREREREWSSQGWQGYVCQKVNFKRSCSINLDMEWVGLTIVCSTICVDNTLIWLRWNSYCFNIFTSWFCFIDFIYFPIFICCVFLPFRKYLLILYLFVYVYILD